VNEIREYIRYDSLNLVSYIIYSEDGISISQGIGRTLNMSQGGILLEIEDLLDEDIKNISMTIAIGENVVNVGGRVAFTLITTAGFTEYGIQFIGTDRKTSEIIECFIDGSLSETQKKPRLLRKKDSRIDSFNLTIVKEHEIILEYIDSYRKLIENTDNRDLIIKIENLMIFLKKDMVSHFFFEENAVFKAALYGNHIDETTHAIINKFKNDHSILMSTLEEILSFLRIIKNEEKKEGEDSLIRKIFVFLGHTKKHCREESEILTSLINYDWEKMRYLNSLLA